MDTSAGCSQTAKGADCSAPFACRTTDFLHTMIIAHTKKLTTILYLLLPTLIMVVWASGASIAEAQSPFNGVQDPITFQDDAKDGNGGTSSFTDVLAVCGHSVSAEYGKPCVVIYYNENSYFAVDSRPPWAILVEQNALQIVTDQGPVEYVMITFFSDPYDALIYSCATGYTNCTWEANPIEIDVNDITNNNIDGDTVTTRDIEYFDGTLFFENNYNQNSGVNAGVVTITSPEEDEFFENNHTINLQVDIQNECFDTDKTCKVIIRVNDWREDSEPEYEEIIDVNNIEESFLISRDLTNNLLEGSKLTEVILFDDQNDDDLLEYGFGKDEELGYDFVNFNYIENHFFIDTGITGGAVISTSTTITKLVNEIKYKMPWGYAFLVKERIDFYSDPTNADTLENITVPFSLGENIDTEITIVNWSEMTRYFDESFIEIVWNAINMVIWLGFAAWIYRKVIYTFRV
jgi:hypothetical protein